LELPVSSLRLIVLLLVGMAAVACDRQKPDAPQAPASPAGPVKGVDRSHRGAEAPTATFADADGRTTDIASFAGAPLLVNLWATWCAPCVAELPTLDRVQGEGGLAVVAISQDSGPQGEVEAFLADHRIVNLEPYHDPEMALSSALGVQVMPTTILYDAAGRELWRFTGDLDWTSAEARSLLAEASPATASSN
jgi:thiol-disulfide isomerase/thioredoxin